MRACVLVLAVLIGGLGVVSDAARSADSSAPEVAELIAEAGNTTDETRREKLLRNLSEHKSVGEELRREAAGMADIAKAWGSSSGGEAFKMTKPGGPQGVPEFEFAPAKDSPLRPIWHLYRARLLAWSLIQSSTIRGDPKQAQLYKDEADRSFKIVAETFPQNEIAAMYLGKSIAWPKEYEAVEGAPRWAVLQREHLDRTRDIILWWIANRQRDDGSFGGGWGDDCEMWRWWSPVLLGFDDPTITAAQLKFSKSALSRPHLKAGFMERLTDVEHAAEDTTDNLVPLMVLEPGEKKWPTWSNRLIDLMQNVWTGANERGTRQFKAFYFAAAEVTDKPQRQLDVIANVAAVNPALLTWLRTRDPQLGKPITEWLDTWVEAAAREENGKPAGMLPASLRWPDGAVAGAGEHWWEPVAPGGYMHGYYVWPSVITEMTDAMLVAHLATGEEKYLAPIRSMAAARLNYLKSPQAGESLPGSETWCAEQLGPRENANSNTGSLVKTLAKCQALTGTHEFDELLKLEGAEFVLSGRADAVQAVEAALEKSLATLRNNFAGFTSEVHGTDRVMRFVQYLSQDYDFDGYRGVTLPKNELVYRMVTGDANAPRFPMPAVRWRTPPTDIAALVTTGNLHAFEAKLFHFGGKPRQVAAELKLLSPGEYQIEFDGEAPRSLVVGSSPAVVSFTLPPQKLCTLRISANTKQAKKSRVETVVVGHKWDDSVGFYDAATGKLEATVPVGRRPHELARSRDGRFAYATLYGLDLYTETAEGGRKVTIVDLEKREKAGEIDLEKYRRPHGIEVGRHSGKLYVTCDHPAALLVLDPESRRIAKAIELADTGALPHMTVVAHDERTAFTANCGNASVTMIDVEAGRETKQIPIGGVPMGMVLTADGKTLFAVNRTAEGIAVIDAETGELRKIIEVKGQPVRVALTPDNRRLVATCIVSGEAAIIDVPTLEIVARVPSGNRVEGLAIDATGRWGYASAQADDRVIRFTLADGRVRQTIPASARPDPLLLQ